MTALTVSRLKGRPFYGQAMGQLRLTCTFSAECAQPEGCGGGCGRSIPHVKRRSPGLRLFISYAPLLLSPMLLYFLVSILPCCFSMLLYCHTMLPCFNLGFQPIKRKEPIFHLSPGVRPGPSSDPCFHQIQIYR